MIQQLPNILTLLRIVLIVPIIGAFINEQFDVALWLFVVAAVSDGFDGLLARRFQSTSRFGSIADPVADKFLLVSCFLLLYYFSLIPWWLMATVVGRDILIFIGALAYHHCISHYELIPSQISKINTCLQLVFVVMFLIDLAYHLVPAAILSLSIWLVMLVTLSSGVDYIWTWGARAMLTQQTRSAPVSHTDKQR